MASPTKDTERGNIHTGILEVKIQLDTDNVVFIRPEHLRECFFIEDIYSTCMTGRVSFVDNYGMYEFGPFTGNETVAIRYGRIENREVVFHVIKVKKIISANPTNSQLSPLVVLEIADTTFEFFTSYRFSRSFDAKTKNTDVVKHIIRNMVGWNDNRQINVLDSSTELEEPWCMPYWTPKVAVDWLLSFSWTKDHYGYLCYGNTYNRHTINVQPITYLLSKDNKTDSDVYKLEVNSQTDDPKELNNKILEWWIDGIDHTQTRTYRNVKYYGPDIRVKKVHEFVSDYDEGIKNTPVMGNYTLFEKNYAGDGSIYSSISIGSGMETEIELKKHSLNFFTLQYNLQQLVNIMVIGNERRFAGHQILIDWSSVDQESATKNRLFDGAYLVKSITHDFINQGSPLGYIQRMVLIKNGFQNPETRLLAKSTNINITGGVRTPEFKGY